MTDLGKQLIVIGIVIVLAGICVSVFGKFTSMGKLPGDILIKRENFTFYFPLTTCILLSIILSLVFYLWNQK